MKNIITYAQTAFDTFDSRPFCSVDSLILSSVSYIHLPDVLPSIEGWRGMRLQELFRAEHFEEMFYDIPMAEDNQKLFTALAASPRFRNILVRGYTEQWDMVHEKQFSAMTFQLQADLCYVAYRGTDSTLVGWKEDFNMAFQSPIPSQEEAVRYIEKAASFCSGRLLVGGHSKGGNLAVYASAMCHENIQSRILKVFSHDGPGFLEDTMQSEPFLRIAPRIEKTIPQSSIVGMLLEHQEDSRIIKSKKVSFWQHDQFSWIVEDNDFLHIETLTKDAEFLDRTLSDWLSGLSAEERERFVDSLYSVLNANNITTLGELRLEWQKNIPATLHAVSQLDGDTKKFLFRTLKALVSLGAKNFPEVFHSEKEKGALP